MKILIAYAGKSGTAKGASELLKNELPNHAVTLADLTKTTPVPGDFDYIVLGGSIRMAKAHRALRRYLKAHGAALAEVPHTLFLCCAIAHQFENYAEMTFPAELLETADETVYFGGELDPARQHGIERLIARMMRNAINESEDNTVGLPGFLPEHVRLLAYRLRAGNQ